MNARFAASDPRSEQLLRDYAVLSGSDADGTAELEPDLDGRFKNLVKLARILCGTPTSFISFVGNETQWFSAREGLALERSPRAHSFCAHAMIGEKPMVIGDARADPRFADNPFVVGAPFIRFYAGVPLRAPEGVALGALCVAAPDPRPNGLSGEQLFGLTTLAGQVMAQLEPQRGARRAAEERELVGQELSHRIRNTFLVISGLIGFYARAHPEARPFVADIRERIAALGRAHNFLQPHSADFQPDVPATLFGLLHELFLPYRLGEEGRLEVTGIDMPIDERGATPLALLMHELVTNAIKYGSLSLPGGTVQLRTEMNGDTVRIAWRERGGPPLPDIAPPDGFGVRVSRLSVEAQLGGTFSRVWKRDGLCVDVAIPRSSLDRGTGDGRLLRPGRRTGAANAAGA